MKSWTICTSCKGEGKIRQRVTRKAQIKYTQLLEDYTKNCADQIPPKKPKGHLNNCTKCNATGLKQTQETKIANTQSFPHVAIIGGGIAGAALAVACLHRQIPFALFERDKEFNSRSQGYGLTLQQASKAIAAFGILELKGKINSTKHIVHNTKGEVLGEWGMRKWIKDNSHKQLKRSNIHIARQALRLALYNEITDKKNIKWNHQLTGIEQNNLNTELTFNTNDGIKKIKTNLVVGADGIRSSVRKLIIEEKDSPLKYLNCIVILGICKLDELKNINSELLDGETVFQTANGIERIYMMPYSETEIMWQLSYPIPEKKAIELSKKGALALKEEALKITKWHSPIPEIVNATPLKTITGYPVYDRVLLNPKLLKNAEALTLIGDAAHPMSPFKGQGANQALLDALELARKISILCKVRERWEEVGLRKKILNDFEKNMIERTNSKVIDSAEAAVFLHSKKVLQKIDGPRGSY